MWSNRYRMTMHAFSLFVRAKTVFPVHWYALLILLVSCYPLSDAQNVSEITNSPPEISSASDLSKLIMHRLAQFLPYYSSTRLSATATQFSVKYPMCFAPRRSTILGSFCASGFDPANNQSASSLSVDVQAGANSAITVFIISDDDQEGQVDRFWAAEASNGSVSVIRLHGSRQRSSFIISPLN